MPPAELLAEVDDVKVRFPGGSKPGEAPFGKHSTSVPPAPLSVWPRAISARTKIVEASVDSGLEIVMS